jgi:hypothetical protein
VSRRTRQAGSRRGWSQPEPIGPILRRTFGPETAKLRVVPAEEERRRERRRRLRTRYAIATDLDRRLAALGLRSFGG